jgi:hypothetical protein
METIYKYEIDPYEPGIEMPKGAEILTVAFQDEAFYIWAKVNPDAEKETRNFQAFGTGHSIPEGMGTDYEYIGTGFMYNGLVFHAFERKGL